MDNKMADNNKLQPGVINKLHALKNAIRARLALEGLAWVVTSLVCLVVVTMLFDFTLKLERELRIFFLAICSLGVLYVLVRTIILPMFVGMDDENLALLVESRNKVLQDRLISALQFTGKKELTDRGVSNALVEKVTEQANSMVEGLDFKAVIEKQNLKKMWTIAGFLIFMLTAFSVARADMMGLWYKRNILLQNIDWPQSTYLEVYYEGRDGNLKPLLKIAKNGDVVESIKDVPVLRGAGLKIVAVNMANSEDPEEVIVAVDYPSTGRTDVTARKAKKAEAKRYSANLATRLDKDAQPCFYVKQFKTVNEAFEFYVFGGDDSRDKRAPHKIKMIEAPTLTKVGIREKYHSYLNRESDYAFRKHDPNQEIIPVKIGSEIMFEGIANKDLSRAKIIVNGGLSKGNVTISSVKLNEKDSKLYPRKFQGSIVLDENNIFTVNGETGKRVLRKNLSVKLQLFDKLGFDNSKGETYVFELIPDKNPEAYLDYRGVRTRVTPDAVIPLIAKADDDNGVESIRIFSKFKKAPLKIKVDENGEPVKEDAPAPADKKEGEKEEGNFELKEFKYSNYKQAGKTITAKDKQDSRSLVGKPYRFELAKLNLKPGAVVVFEARCKDRLLKRLGGPNRSVSPEVKFEIISKIDLATELVAIQDEISGEFEQMMKLQVKANSSTAEAIDELFRNQQTETVINKINNSHVSEKAVLDECKSALGRYRGVLAEMEANKIATDDARAALRLKIVSPLSDLADNIKTVEELLAQAEKLTDESDLKEATSEIQRQQKYILESMRTIYSNMLQGATKMALAYDLNSIKKGTDELDKEIQEKSDKENEGTLEDEDGIEDE